MAIIFSLLELFPFYSSSIGSGDIWPWQPFAELLKGPLGTLDRVPGQTLYPTRAHKLKPSASLSPFQEVRRQLYRRPAWIKNHTSDSGSFFGALGFTLPVEESTSLSTVLEWLTLPRGPYLVDGSSAENRLTALAILVSPEAFEDPEAPLVGLGFMYRAPYIQTTSWSEAYFELKLALQTEASHRLVETKVIFIQIQVSSQVIPLPSVPTLFLDMKTPEEVTDSKVLRPTQDFRGFHLHQVIITGEDPPVSQVAIPRLQGDTLFHWVPLQDQVLPPEMEGAPLVSATLAKADPSHWNIQNDPIYPACLELFKARHEASMASQAAPSMGEGSEDSTHVPEPFPTMTQPTTPPLTAEDIDAWVGEVMDRVHDLNLLWIQEMGFVQEIDHALSKSLVVEFLRLQILMGEDLSAALWAWQAEMEVATDNLLRDLGATTQVGTTLPSLSAAVGTALQQFRVVVQLKMALPLTQLEEARERMEGYI